jgi:hypothetical protein
MPAAKTEKKEKKTRSWLDWIAPLVWVAEAEELLDDEVEEEEEVDMVCVAGVPGLPLVVFAPPSSWASLTMPPKTSAGEEPDWLFMADSLNFSRVSSELSL